MSGLIQVSVRQIRSGWQESMMSETCRKWSVLRSDRILSEHTERERDKARIRMDVAGEEEECSKNWVANGNARAGRSYKE